MTATIRLARAPESPVRVLPETTCARRPYALEGIQ